MNRDTILAGLVAVTGVVAIAIAAATLEDRWTPDSGVGSPGTGGEGQPPPPPMDGGDGIVIPYLDEILTLLVALVLVVGAIYLIRNYRRALPIVVAIVVFSGLLMFLGSQVDIQDPEMPADFEEPFPGAPGGNGETAPPTTGIDWLPILTILGIFGLVILVAIGVSLGRGGRSLDVAAEEPSAEDTRSGAVSAEIAQAAGRAADRIEASDTYHNEVYRAWAEMTDLLELSNPAVATPRDFAEEAIEVGLAPEDVRGLTRLFEEVRYGDREPTPVREDRAVTLLRRIEDRYAEET